MKTIRAPKSWRRNRSPQIVASYFLLYYLEDDEYAFEFVGDIDQNDILNIEKFDKSKGMLFKKYRYLPESHLFTAEKPSGDDVIPDLEYYYVTSDYNNRATRIKEEKSYYKFFKRSYVIGESAHKYLALLNLGDSFVESNQRKYLSLRPRYDGEYLKYYYSDIGIIHGRLLADLMRVVKPFLYNNMVPTTKADLELTVINRIYVEIIIYYWFVVPFVNQSFGIFGDITSLISDTDRTAGDYRFFCDCISRLKEILSKDFDIRKKYCKEFQKDIEEKYGENSFFSYIFERLDLENVQKYLFETVIENTIDSLGKKGVVDNASEEKKYIIEFVEILESLSNESCSVHEKDLRLDFDKGEMKGYVYDLLDYHDEMVKRQRDGIHVADCFEIEEPFMSEGEKVRFNLFSKIDSCIYNGESDKDIVLLLDEPDKSLHPEWARCFIDDLIQVINKATENTNQKVQVIITSHSPFIVTEIFPENVFAITAKEGKRVIKNEMNNFASNIYLLLMDSFMMNNTFGEYSYKKLLSYSEKLTKKEESISSDDFDEIQYVIDRIGEKAVKEKMIELVDEYRDRSKVKNDIIQKIYTITDDELLEKIKGLLNKYD